MSEIVVACACCGRPGALVEFGDEVRIRCVLHTPVVDAEDWLRARAAMRCAFATEAELMGYFRRDYGAGVEMIQGLQRDPDDADETRH